MEFHKYNSLKHSLIFSQKVAQLSKALWKSVEKDWQNWIKPFNLNINEHHILWIAYHLDGASISDIANFGVMHVSTAFNFSRKLEKRNILYFSKKETDKRNTYVKLTDKGRKLFLETLQAYDQSTFSIYEGVLPLKELYGTFPHFQEIISIVRHIYGASFIEKMEDSLLAVDHNFDEENNLLQKESEKTL